MSKCLNCNQTIIQKNVRVSDTGFVKCGQCGNPIFDANIQNKKHWIWEYLSEKQKKKFGFYEKGE